MEPVNKSKIATTARLYDGGGDTSKRPFVYYHFKNPETGKMQRFREYEGFAQCKTLEAIRLHGNKLAKKISRKLRNGYNPFANKQIIYTEVSTPLAPAVPQIFVGIDQHLKNILSEQQAIIQSTSYNSYLSQVRTFTKWLKDNDWLSSLAITEFSEEHVRKFFHYLAVILKRHPTTRNQYRTNLKHLFKLLLERKIIEYNSFECVKKLPTQKTSKKPFNEYQRKQLKDYIQDNNSELWFCVLFIYYCFIRPKEIRLLKISDIDMYEEKITVRAEISKNKKTQYVRIPKPFMKIINSQQLHLYPGNYFVFGNNGTPGLKPRSKNHFNSKHLEILRLLGYSEQYCLYSWKHTGAITAVKAGINLKELQMQLRHHSLDMVNEYLKNLGVLDSDFLQNRFPEL